VRQQRFAVVTGRWEVAIRATATSRCFWTESAFRTRLGDAGLGVEWTFPGEDSEEGHWLMLLARKES
jgi:hypothetical protein